jgi:hypothetical protein
MTEPFKEKFLYFEELFVKYLRLWFEYNYYRAKIAELLYESNHF